MFAAEQAEGEIRIAGQGGQPGGIRGKGKGRRDHEKYYAKCTGMAMTA